MTTTRRSFLQSAGAAAAAASLPASAYARVVGANERIHIGVIGTGGMGRGHADAFSRWRSLGHGDVDVTALADVCRPRLTEVHGLVTGNQDAAEVATHRDYRELLDRKDLDGVVIASPEHWHAQMSIDAMEAGKDVYCEKPMTFHLSDAIRVLDAAKASSQVFQVGTQHVNQRKYHAAKEIVDSGVAGPLVWSQTSYCRNNPTGEWLYYAIDPKVVPGPELDWKAWCGPQGEVPFDTNIYHRWRRYSRWSTGIIGDLLVHVVTPMVWAMGLGWPTRIQATGGHYVDKVMDNFDQVNLTVQWGNRHTMVVAGSTSNERGLEPMIRGHKANIFLSGKDVVVRPERVYADDVDEQRIDCDAVSDHLEHRKHWLNCMRERTEPLSGAALGAQLMVMVDLAARSMWSGQTFTFDPESRTAKAL